MGCIRGLQVLGDNRSMNSHIKTCWVVITLTGICVVIENQLSWCLNIANKDFFSA